ncbi:MAG: RpoL/Rpb11 RNA polymerase subunit family protein [Candidatus Aenigmatarchaeota archaeon]
MVEVKVIESKSDKLKVEILGDNNLTLVNLLNENLWQQKGVVAACVKKHPYIAQPEIMVRASSPDAKLKKAAEQIIKDVEDLEKQLKK